MKWRFIAVAAILVSAAWTTAPRLLDSARRAVAMSELSMSARRRQLMGPTYEQVLHLRKLGKPVALLVKHHSENDVAVFIASYLYPLRAPIYWDINHVRLDPQAPKTIVRIDAHNGPFIRSGNYETIRADELRYTRKRRDLTPSVAVEGAITVPIAASIDGPPPDIYVTEAVLENGAGEARTVTLELLPSQRTTTLTLAAGERREWYDLIWESFGVMDHGWLRVSSSGSGVRAGFWLVNRGTGDMDAVRVEGAVSAAAVTLPQPGRLFVMNPGNRAANAVIGGEHVVIAPLDRAVRDTSGRIAISSDQPVVAFASWRDARNDNHLVWMEPAR